MEERTNDELFRVREPAEHFGVCAKTIHRGLWAKGIPAYEVGQLWRIAKKDLIKEGRNMFK